MDNFYRVINEEIIIKTADICRSRGIIIPTIAQQKDPKLIPESIKEKLRQIGLWDIDPLNLFRISWKNDINTGLYGEVNHIEIPESITGVKAKIIGLIGKYFPTGAHKVGAAFGCLVPKLVTGHFYPTVQKAVWPSTGNFCRGGAFDSVLLASQPVAILPEGMSKERFEWLKNIGAEIIATPGSESNVKEIYDECWNIRRTRPECVIFNQFEEFGNAMWHYEVTGSAIEELYNNLKTDHSRLSCYVSATGSAGTLGAGDYLKKVYPRVKIIATEAIQCPTLLENGFGSHRIEGIGDKHVPWIHNIRNTDMIAAIDDEATINIMRLFNESAGLKFLENEGLIKGDSEKLSLIGISGICNILAAIKAAKYWELEENDFIFTPLTDSMELYGSRIQEEIAKHGDLDRTKSAQIYSRYLLGQGIDNVKELNYRDKKSIHNLKYFTWVEQQGKTVEDLNSLWSDEFWEIEFSKGSKWDELIDHFNRLS